MPTPAILDARGVAQRVETACREYPLPALGLSFGAGLALGLSPVASGYVLRFLGGVAVTLITNLGRDVWKNTPSSGTSPLNWN